MPTYTFGQLGQRTYYSFLVGARQVYDDETARKITLVALEV